MTAKVLRAGLMALTLLAPAAAGAETAAPQSAVRLLAGEEANGEWPVGVEITLADGWKTYWRMPGESGVPPDFDWSSSSNLGSVQVLYPAPSRFEDAGGETIGYKHRVVFPVKVRPKSEKEPVELKLTLHYAVCKDICVPAKAEVARLIGQTSAPVRDAASIEQFEALVPKPEAEGLRLEGVRLAEEDGKPALMVEVEGPAAEKTLDIFVEGPGSGYFRAPRRRKEAGGNAVFALPIDGLKDANALKGRTVTLTIVADGARLVREARVE